MNVVRPALIIASMLLTGNVAGGDAASAVPSMIRTATLTVMPAAEPAAGRFLVARRSLDDPHFRRSVIYLLKHGAQGTAGLIINRPSGLNLSDAVSGIDDSGFASRPVYFGGPVEFNTVSMLIRDEQETRLIEHIADDVYLSGDRSVLERLLGENKPDNALHFYLGHAGWLPGQLAREIKQEDWYVIDTDPAVIFSARPEALWKRLIEKLDPVGLYAGNTPPRDTSSARRKPQRGLVSPAWFASAL